MIVRAHPDDEIAGGSVDAEVQRSRRDSARVLDHAHRWMCSLVSLYDLNGPVFAFPVDNEHLESGFQVALDKPLFVTAGHENRDQWQGVGHPLEIALSTACAPNDF